MTAFIFKFNATKLKDQEKLEDQICKVAEALSIKHSCDVDNLIISKDNKLTITLKSCQKQKSNLNV